jgi:hypothetical protein
MASVETQRLEQREICGFQKTHVEFCSRLYHIKHYLREEDPEKLQQMSEEFKQLEEMTDIIDRYLQTFSSSQLATRSRVEDLIQQQDCMFQSLLSKVIPNHENDNGFFLCRVASPSGGNVIHSAPTQGEQTGGFKTLLATHVSMTDVNNAPLDFTIFESSTPHAGSVPTFIQAMVSLDESNNDLRFLFMLNGLREEEAKEHIQSMLSRL